MKHTIRWVVALKPEANPLIERFGLRHVRESPDLFPVYRSKDGDVELVISGPGKVSAAAATSFLASRSAEETVAGWINFGIAGGGGREYGQAFLGAKIQDRATGQAWYPPAVIDRRAGVSRLGIETVDQPTEIYPEDGTLIEMEAAGFYPTALRVSSAEVCQVIKVVSDDEEHPVADISKGLVEELCGTALDQILPWWEAFRAILAEEASRVADPPGFGEWQSVLKFSETQRHRLRRLLRQWQSVNPGDKFVPQFTPVETSNAQCMLDALEAKIRGMTTAEF